MNLTGQWRFFEQFEGGFDIGYALLNQKDEFITGTLVYTEYIYDDAIFLLEVKVEGLVEDDRLMLNGTSYSILESEFEFDYCLDNRIAELNDEDRIEGHSVDDQNLEGRFILKRLNLTKD